MPATRSRTNNWRRSLEQLHQRGGSIELTLPSNADDAGHARQPSLIWRVRILDFTSDAIVLERPSALGVAFDLTPGVELVGIIAIGQNRWMFTSVLQRQATFTDERGRAHDALVLPAPENVERCQRRAFYRMSTISLGLPEVAAWPLLDPHSAAVAQAACRARFETATRNAGESPSSHDDHPDADLAMPNVGPRFPATLVNIGGGGVGLLVHADNASNLNAHNLFFLNLDLGETLPAPIAVSARLRHNHIDSAHHVHAGFAFEFSLDPAHERFVAGQFARYIDAVQRQLRTSG